MAAASRTSTVHQPTSPPPCLGSDSVCSPISPICQYKSTTWSRKNKSAVVWCPFKREQKNNQKPFFDQIPKLVHNDIRFNPMG